MNHALIFSSRTHPWERSGGAHRIATYLRKNGMDVEVIDFAAHWNLEILKEFTRRNVKPTTLFFGFSIFFSYWNQTMKDFSAWLKEEYPNIKTVAGGQHLLQSELTDIDIWVDSFGEEAALAIAKSLANNSTSGIRFLASEFGRRKVVKALETYPSFNMKDYSVLMEQRDFLEPWEWLTVEFARGCKFSCAFCNFPVLGIKEDTSRTAESFEYEMKYNYDNFGINRYYVADETFNDRVEKITKFADVVEKLEFDTVFSGFIRADLLSNANMIQELARMNFAGQYYGVETFNKESGKVVGKGLDPEKVKQLILDTKKYFYDHNKTYRGTISLIAGLPYDTRDNWDKTMKWLRENWITEGLVTFPLSVESLDVSESSYTKLSKFSLNLQKYGLRSLGSSKVELHKDPGGGYYNWKEGNYAAQETLWEHDTMDIFEAKAISSTAQNAALYEFALDSWCMSWPELSHRRKLENLQEHLNSLKIQSQPNRLRAESFVKMYSLKKLNNRP